MFECLKSWHTKLKIGKPFGMLARFMARWHVYWHIACRSKKLSRFRYALGTLARRPRWHAGTYDARFSKLGNQVMLHCFHFCFSLF